MFRQSRVFISHNSAPAYALSGSVHTIGPLSIHCDKEVQHYIFLDCDGRQIAWGLGHIYIAGSGFWDPDTPFQLKVKIDSLADVEQHLLGRLGGNFILITGGPLAHVLYMDPAGAMPIVFSTDKKSAASTPDVLLTDDEYAATFDSAMHHTLIEKEGVGAWLPGSLTAHKGLKRLLPNHALDLDQFCVRRHWPTNPSDFKWRDPGASRTLISHALSQFCAAAADTFNLYSALTAGQDTRLVLAACVDVKDRVTFFTNETGKDRIDLDIPKALSDMLGLSYTVFPIVQATPEQAKAWDRAVGDCIIEYNKFNFPTLLQLPQDAAIMSGLYGEVGCCRLYRQDHLSINDKDVTAVFVLKRLSLPVTPASLAATEEWLAPIRDFPGSVILDLAFWEIKFGGWSMSQRPAQGSLRLHLTPIAQRDILEAFVHLKPADKKLGAFNRSCISQLWPKLDEVPINKYGDFRDMIILFKKIIDPGRVRRYVRQKYKG